MAKSSTSFKAGNPGKPPGAKNAVTQDVREKFRALLDGVSIQQLQQDLLAIENPKDRLQIIIGLSEYLIPKLARTQLAADDAGDGRVSVTLNLGGPAKADGE